MDGKRAQYVKHLPCKTDELSAIPVIPIEVEKENPPHRAVP